MIRDKVSLPLSILQLGAIECALEELQSAADEVIEGDCVVSTNAGYIYKSDVEELNKMVSQEIDHLMFGCTDCRVNTRMIDEYYMVHNHLWSQVGMEPDGGMLCIGCLEKRLGRRLVPADFTSAPVNTNGFGEFSERLRDRLGLQERKAA